MPFFLGRRLAVGCCASRELTCMCAAKYEDSAVHLESGPAQLPQHVSCKKCD